MALTTGCGGTGTTFSGNTAVTVVASSTANDQLVQYSLNLTGLTLTGKSGKTVNLLTTPESEEFIHVNGTGEPLFTTSVPQGVYTSASVTIGGAQFSCATLDSSGGLDNSTYAYGATPSSQVTVNLPAPITVTGGAMGLVLDFLVSQAATFASCDPDNGSGSFSITPTFDLTSVAFSSQPTNSQNGKLTGLDGIVASVDAAGSGFTVTTQGDGPGWTVSTSSTVYQGINGPSALVAGLPMDMDVAVQADGSLLATRVEVDNANAADLSAWKGPVEFVGSAEPVLLAGAVEEQGFLFNSAYILGGSPFSFGDAVFQPSGQLTNIQSLPFTAVFTAANVVPGQNISVTTNASTFGGAYPTYNPAATVTLEPQTINGTVEEVSSEGGFTTYTVSLASYDLFPDLAEQQGQTTLLTSANSVVVYVDSSTQMLNANSLTAGGLFRFYGLVFNDNGTLRMDCAQVNDGVAE
ncbi:MAG: hypothetical protein WBE72_17865 [Terracidiphilus sp.]